MKRLALKETLPNECIELFNYDPTLTIRNVMLRSTSPRLPKGKNIKLRLYIASSHTTCAWSTLFISDRKSGKATPGDSRVQEKTYIRTFTTKHPPHLPRRLVGCSSH